MSLLKEPRSALHVLNNGELAARGLLHERELIHAHVLHQNEERERLSAMNQNQRGMLVYLHHEKLLFLLPGADREKQSICSATNVPAFSSVNVKSSTCNHNAAAGLVHWADRTELL